MAKSEKMISVSPSRLKYAREYYGLSIEYVSKRIKNIKCEDLEKYEKGEDFPSYTKLELLANLYNRPLLYFFFQTELKDKELIVDFRSIEKQSGHPLNMQVRTMIERADLFRLNLYELFSYTTDALPVPFVRRLESDNIDTETKLIKWLREKLELPLTKQKRNFSRAEILLEYIRDKLYDIGVYIFKDSFKADDVSGLCLYDEKFPIILLNNKTSFTRQIFTVFHEIYHLFNKELDVYYLKSEDELACNQFASEFLIPEADLQACLLGRSTFEDIDFIEGLAKEYTVSPSALAYRLMKQGKISKDFYEKIQKDGIRKINSATSGGNFYFTRISYLGRPYLKNVFSEYYAGRINIAEVSKYTGLKASHISKLSSNMSGGVF